MRFQMALRSGAVILALSALVCGFEARAQAFQQFTNAAGTVSVGGKRMPELNCAQGTLCEGRNTVGIGTGWTDVQVFLKELTLSTSTSGASVSRVYAAVEKVSYDSGNGNLIVAQKVRFNNSSASNISFMAWYTFIATKPSGGGSAPVSMVAVSTSCTGDTEFGCNTSPLKTGIKPSSSYAMYGFATSSIDLDVTSGKNIDVGRIHYSSKVGNFGTTWAYHQLDCIMSASVSPGEPFSCSMTGFGVSAVANTFVSNTGLEQFTVDSSSAAYSRTKDYAPGVSVVGAFTLLEELDMDRTSYSVPYAAVSSLQPGCGSVAYDSSNIDGGYPYGRVSVGYVAKLTNQSSYPWAWYLGAIQCRYVYLK